MTNKEQQEQWGKLAEQQAAHEKAKSDLERAVHAEVSKLLKPLATRIDELEDRIAELEK